jgi:olfactory receptor
MDQVNYSVMTEFVLLGLELSLGIQIFLILFSLFYVGIIPGNLLIVFTVVLDPHLHSPIYILMANLFLIDLGLSSTTVSKAISDLFTNYTAEWQKYSLSTSWEELRWCCSLLGI